MNRASEIRELLWLGLSTKEIAEKTGVSYSTIRHHARSLGIASIKDAKSEELKRLVLQGTHNTDEIAEMTGYSIDAVYKCRRKLGLDNKGKRAGVRKALPTPTRDWNKIQAFYDEGNLFKDVRVEFAISNGSLCHAVKQGYFKPRSLELPLHDVLVEGSTYKRGCLKRRIFKEGLLENICSNCNLLPEWDGKPLVLVLDHVNGVNNDNRLENLRLLCPNCNSQTDTFAGRNIKKPTAH